MDVPNKMNISDEEHKKRLNFYNKGETDTRIAELVGCSSPTIYYWRQKHNLEPNMKAGNPLSEEEENERMRFYDLGFDDKQIAEKLNVSSEAIHEWRKLRGLDSNFKSIIDLFDKNIKQFYDQGYSDKYIADKIGCSKSTIKLWRKKKSLKPNTNYELTKEQIEYRNKLFEEGLSDKEIADILGIKEITAKIWRRKNFGSEENSTILEEYNEVFYDLYNEGYSDRDIASKCSVSRSTVRRWRQENNLEPNF
ncbi:MAG: helix-turn-helix domain-containing protein [bacterium]